MWRRGELRAHRPQRCGQEHGAEAALAHLRVHRRTIRLRGRVAALMEVGSGVHPELTGRENIWLYGQILGMKKSDIRRRFDEIVEFSELGDAIDTPVKFYSSGMQLRLGLLDRRTPRTRHLRGRRGAGGRGRGVPGEMRGADDEARRAKDGRCCSCRTTSSSSKRSAPAVCLLLDGKVEELGEIRRCFPATSRSWTKGCRPGAEPIRGSRGWRGAAFCDASRCCRRRALHVLLRRRLRGPAST